jgi:hypothetical protein
MGRARILLSSLLLLLPSVAMAGPEELAPKTAHAEVSQTSGVVLVDLFAHW